MSRRNKIIETVKKVISDNLLIESGDKVLVAFSGGADSVCLLYILNSLKEEMDFKLFAAHLNHSIRGEAAEHDEAFSKAFCEKIGVLCITEKKDVRGYAKEYGLSEELSGRELRYDFFKREMLKRGINKLAVGHHADDQAETVLLHLMRGSGIDGLSGMRYKTDEKIRPLLDLTKNDILDFCSDEGLDFCTDHTNFETEYTRNKVRLELVPKMSEFNPNITKSILRTSKILADEADFLELTAEQEYRCSVVGNEIDISKLLSCHISVQRRIIRKMIEKVKLTQKDISFDYTDKVLNLCRKGQTGKEFSLGDGIIAFVEYGKLKIDKEYEKKSLYKEIPTDSKTQIGNILINPADFKFPKNARLAIRTRQNGDRIYPFGIRGSKKLKDFFIDEKVLRSLRDEAVILTCNDEIAAVFYGDKVFYDRRFK